MYDHCIFKIDYINFLYKKNFEKYQKLKNINFCGFYGLWVTLFTCATVSICGPRSYHAIIIVRAGSVPVDTTLHHPNYLQGWAFFTNTSPQASHVWRPSLHIDCQAKWKIFCYMKLNYMLIQHINLTHSFIKLYNEILLAHKISDKYLTMLDIDLIKSNEILVFCNRT